MFKLRKCTTKVQTQVSLNLMAKCFIKDEEVLCLQL